MEDAAPYLQSQRSAASVAVSATGSARRGDADSADPADPALPDSEFGGDTARGGGSPLLPAVGHIPFIT